MMPLRRELFAWEKELLQSLFLRLEGVELREGDDCWWWKPEEGGIFSVKSCYSILQRLRLVEGGLSGEVEVVFRNLWKSKVPAKVLAFLWTLFLDRIPTKVNLARRKLLAIEGSKRCVFCGLEDESTLHLFLHSQVTCRVWLEVMRWLQFFLINSPNLFIHIDCWLGMWCKKKWRRGAWLIWHSVIWVIWNSRNDRIFNDKVKEVDEMVEEIKVLLWNWSLNRLKISSCLFYEWCWNPRECLGR